MNRLLTHWLVVVGLCVLMWPSSAEAWWNESWDYRKRIDIDPTSLGVSEPLVEVPVLLRLHTGNFSYFGDMRPDGADLRVVAADDITPIKFDIETFDPVAQVALVWVFLPQLLPGVPDQFFYLYYGNPEGQLAGSSGFDRNYTAVFHFADSDPLADATAFGTRMQSASPVTTEAGLIGKGIRFGGSQYLEIPPSPALAILPQRGFTLSLWLNPDLAGANGVLYEINDPLTQRSFQLSLADATPVVSLLDTGSGELITISELVSERALVPAQWQHLAVQVSDSAVRMFVNGALTDESSWVVPALTGGARLGNSLALDAPISGVRLDELRLSTTARSAAWLGVSARGHSMDSISLFYGEDSQREEGGEESHFVTTLRNVDWGGLEGIVVFICMVMAVVTWYLMAVKGLATGRVRAANQKFLESYRASEGSVFAHDQSSLLQPGSTLSELYELGMEEIGKRVGGRSVGAAAVQSLSSESISAIRAFMTGQNVRISQRLSSMLVLLTLAIAGGPFLGLLGTVVGVMVTFAGIAASGDVNINAIAPGIAAALVATVAGLVVAIPALFGYNYISSRVKEVIIENNVFLEEFIATATEEFQG